MARIYVERVRCGAAEGAVVELGRKENEITKAPKALGCVEISQKVVTADAMHTQKGLSAQIVRQGGDYIFPVKENQLNLYKKHPATLCTRISEGWIWKDRDRFPHR